MRRGAAGCRQPRSRRGANVLPIYIEDNHAGTFYWLAQNIDLDQSCTLVLFDAHSDASGIFDSDKIRDALRNVASRRSTNVARSLAQRRRCPMLQLDRAAHAGADRKSHLGAGREAFRIPKFASARNKQQRYSTAISKQRRGNRDHCKNRTLFPISRDLQKHLDPNQPVIVTIDLDYFARPTAPEQEQAFAQIWNFVIERQTFAPSRLQFRVRT